MLSKQSEHVVARVNLQSLNQRVHVVATCCRLSQVNWRQTYIISQLLSSLGQGFGVLTGEICHILLVVILGCSQVIGFFWIVDLKHGDVGFPYIGLVMTLCTNPLRDHGSV